MTDMVVMPGRGSTGLGQELATQLDCPVAKCEFSKFPDGELYVRITDDVKGREVVCVQTTMPNDNLVELLLMQDAALQAGAKAVITVIPYFAYARQDQEFLPGEAISARAIVRALATSSTRLIVVDPHKEHILDFFDGKSEAVSAIPQICQQLSDWNIDAILAPDKGARNRAEEAAKILGVPFDHLEKKRIDATTVEMKAKELDVAGKNVAIIDDMIASGSTMVTAAGQLKAQGAKTVVAACTHGVYSEGAVEKLLSSGIDHVLCTDTIEGVESEYISCAASIAGALLAQLPTP